MFNELQKKKKLLFTYLDYGPSLEDICPDDIKTISQMYLVRKVFNIKTWLWWVTEFSWNKTEETWQKHLTSTSK